MGKGTKVTDAEVERIRQMYSRGLDVGLIASCVGRSMQTVYRAINGSYEGVDLQKKTKKDTDQMLQLIADQNKKIISLLTDLVEKESARQCCSTDGRENE